MRRQILKPDSKSSVEKCIYTLVYTPCLIYIYINCLCFLCTKELYDIEI